MKVQYVVVDGILVSRVGAARDDDHNLLLGEVLALISGF